MDSSCKASEVITNGIEESPRRPPQKCPRPTELVFRRPASATPYHGRRPHDVSTPPPSEHLEFAQLKDALLKKSGVLTYNFERITASKDDFIDEGQLGAGTCGVVKKMRHRTRRDLVMAVKQMHVSSTCAGENKRIMVDLDVVTKCVGCPNIVKCIGIFFSMSEVWICMEVMSTSLDNLIHDTVEPFPEYVLGKIAVSIVKALDYLKREHNMMHRDVKPSNMLLSSSGDIKLCDFGISGQLKDSIANSNQLGCIGYMAPERLEKFKYDVRADIWSLGISLVELALKSFPYKGSQFEFAILTKILDKPAPTIPNDGRYSAEFRCFVDKCLIKDYQQRPKYAELRRMDLFRTYDRQPYDVGDWYRTVRLNPREGMDGGGGGEGLYRHPTPPPPLSPASSTVTLSPDGARNWPEPPATGGGGAGGGTATAIGRSHPSFRSQTLPPPGTLRHASPTPPLPDNVNLNNNSSNAAMVNALDKRARAYGYNSAVGSDGVVLRNRGRPLVPSGRKYSDTPISVPPAMDARRNAFYPYVVANQGDYPVHIANTYTTTLQAYLNCLNNSNASNGAQARVPYSPSHSRSARQSPSLPPAASPSLLRRAMANSPAPNGRSSHNHQAPPRSVSPALSNSSRRIQRAPAYRLNANPYQPTRVADNSESPVFTFTPQTKKSLSDQSPPVEQVYHHEYFWYAHQQQPPSLPPAAAPQQQPEP